MNVSDDFTIRLRLEVLSKAEIEALYQGVLDVLGRIGAQVLHPEAIELLKEAGCSIGKDSRVKISCTLG